MGKIAVGEPVAKSAKAVTASSVGVASQEHQGGSEPSHFLNRSPSSNTVPSDLTATGENLWQPMIQSTLEKVGQTLLDWCWQAFEQRYGEQLENLNTARALTSQLLDPQLSLFAKCTALLNVLETSTVAGSSITPYLDVARQLKTILNGLQQPGSGVVKRGIDTLSNLLALLDLPAAQQMAGKDTLTPVRDLLSGALEWAQTLQRLSNASWDSPQTIVDGLMQSGALPTWVSEVIEQGQRLYETLSSQLAAIKNKGEQLQRLHGLLIQFNEAISTKAKFTALLTLLLDEDMLGLIEQYAPAAMGDGLKTFALFKNALQDGGEQDTTGLRSTLLSMEHVTSQPFIDRLGSEAGAVGQMMAEPLSNVRAALRGSASQEAAFNLLLGLTDPKKTWTAFLRESSREMLLLPQVQDLGASFASRFAWQVKAVKALYAVLDDTFWAQYKKADWSELPTLISDTALRDTQNKQSQLAIALAAASGIPGEHIQTVFTEVSNVCRSWGNDSWAEFLPKVTGSIENLLAVLVKHGQLLPTYVQTLLDIGLWAAKGISRLLMLHSVWKAKADDEVLGDATLALIRKAIEEYAGDNVAWAFDKAVIWLPMLPPLYTVLGNLEPIKEGQRVQWLANVLMRLYSLPEAQANKDVIWLREQIEAKAEQWLGGIPAAVLGNAIVEESRSKPGYDLTPLFTRAVQLQGLASYMSTCFTSITNALQGADVLNSMETLLNPAGVHAPGRQRPAYLRDPSTFYAALPDSHPQLPLSTTTQNIAPIAWGAGAGATFLGGILFTYFAHKNYRKGNQTTSQADNKSGIPLVPMGDVNAEESPSTASQADALLGVGPYTSPSVPLIQKKSHWKKTGPLAAMASVMFSASAYSLWKAHDAIADNTERVKLSTLEALEAKAREDFYTGQTNTLSDDLTQFTETITTDEPTTEWPTRTRGATPSTVIDINHDLNQYEYNNSITTKNSQEIESPLDIRSKHTQKVKKDTLVKNQAIDVLPLMREATALVKTLTSEKSAGKNETQLKLTHDRLAMVVVKLKTLRNDLTTVTPEQYAEHFTDHETKAYYLLAEMKAYYPAAVADIWGQFAPNALITYTYRNRSGGPEEASAPLIDFVNGAVARQLENRGLLKIYGFEGPREGTEVASFLSNDPRLSAPGEWTKKQTLNNTKFFSRDYEREGPSMTDTLILKVQPSKTPTESLQEKTVSLDQFLKGEHKNFLGHAPDFFILKEIKWPLHYTKAWIQSIHKPGVRDAYLKGQQVIEAINTNIEEDAETQAFAASFWTVPEILTVIKNHEKLKALNKDSTITLAITHNNETLSYDMTLVSFLCSEYKRFFPSSISIKITHPFQLIPSTDSTVQGLIDQCTAAREMNKNILTIDSAMNNLKLPSVMGILQERLNQELIKKMKTGQSQRFISIDDDVEVEYKVHSSDITAEGPTAINNKDTKSFKIWEIMGKAHRRYRDKMGWVNMNVDPHKKYDAGVLALIINKNWSQETDQVLKSYPNKTQLKKDWVKVFKPLITRALAEANAAGVNLMGFDNKQLKFTTNDRFKLLGVYRISTGPESFELRSIFSPKVWSFQNTAEYNVALNHTPYESPTTTPSPVEKSKTHSTEPEGQNNKELYAWLNQHLQASNQKVNTGNNRLITVAGQHKMDAGTATEKMFDDYFERLTADADFYLNSDNELLFRSSIKFFSVMLGSFLSLGLPISGPLSMLLSTGLVVLPLAQVAVVDSREEFKELLMEAFMGGAEESGGILAGKLFPATLVKPLIKKIVKTKKIKTKALNKNALPDTKAPNSPSSSKNPIAANKSVPAGNQIVDKIVPIRIGNKFHNVEIKPINSHIIHYSVKNDPANNILCSAHAAYRFSSKKIPAPSDMTMQFLAPHGYELADPGINFINTQGGMKPHTIISPGGIEIIHSPLKPGPGLNSVPHTNNTTLKEALGSKEKGYIKNYYMHHYPGDTESEIIKAIANNRALVEKNTAGVIKSDVLVFSPPVDPKKPTMLELSDMIKIASQLPTPPTTLTMSMCRKKYSNAAPNKYQATKSSNVKVFEETYDMTGTLISRRLMTARMLNPLFNLESADDTPALGESADNTPALDESTQAPKDSNLDDIATGTTYDIVGPFDNDEWRKKYMWESGIAFSMFEAMDTYGSVEFTGPGDQLLYLRASDPIDDNRWKLQWKINPDATQRPGTQSPSGTVPPLTGSATGFMMDDVLANISNLLPYFINNQDLEVSVYIGKENIGLFKEQIVDDHIISVDENLYKEEQPLVIKEQSGVIDSALNGIEPRLLPTYFNTYLNVKQISGYADKSINILNYLLSLHAQFKSVTWPNPITRIAIENSFESLSTSPTIAQILTDLLVANSMSQPPAAGESQLSKSGISSFIRGLMEQCYLDLNYSPDDSGLNRSTMAEKFDQHTQILIDFYFLKPDFAKWLTVIKYMDADIDGLLSRQQTTYDASYKSLRYVNNTRPILNFEEVGSIQTYNNALGHPSSVSRHQRARVRIMKNNDYVYEKLYEIPMAYRQPSDMTAYIANAINLDMLHKDFDTTDPVEFDISFAAGVMTESRNEENQLTGSFVTVEKNHTTPIFSNINQVTNNPAINYVVIVDFI